jgi:hypothetical protein
MPPSPPCQFLAVLADIGPGLVTVGNGIKASDVMLPLVAALWACGTLFHVITKDQNDRRDRILSARIGDRWMTPELRRIVLEQDWRPLIRVTVVVALAFAVMAFALPWLLPDHERTWPVWVVSWAVVLFAGLVAIAILGWAGAEWRQMDEYIKTGKVAVSDTPPGPEPQKEADAKTPKSSAPAEPERSTAARDAAAASSLNSEPTHAPPPLGRR